MINKVENLDASDSWVNCMGRWWEWMLSDDAVPYLDVTFFIASCIILYLTMEACQICVFVLLLVSMVFCCRFKYMFFVLWACIGVLWIHGWRFGGGKGLSVQWN